MTEITEEFSEFIPIEMTPNPNSLKFIVNKIPEQTIFFQSLEEATNSYLAQKILSIQDVQSVFFGSGFITVTKNDLGSWDILTSEIIITISLHFKSGLTFFEKDMSSEFESTADKANQGILLEVERQIIEIIDTRVRPSVAMDGGDIIYKGFTDGVVYLEMRGACVGCPSSTITLKNGIETMLKHYIPEVDRVESI